MVDGDSDGRGTGPGAGRAGAWCKERAENLRAQRTRLEAVSKQSQRAEALRTMAKCHGLTAAYPWIGDRLSLWRGLLALEQAALNRGGSGEK